jgi:hypothetical protein
MEHRNTGVMEYWSGGVLEHSSVGALEYWSKGVLGCWDIAVVDVMTAAEYP